MAKIRQFWLVAPLDIKEDGPVGRIQGNDLGFAQDAARPRRAAPEEIQVAPPGYGFKIASADIKRMQMGFTTEQAAKDYAKNEAEKNPKVLFGVFGCNTTYETTTPTIIQKSFNQDGELTPVKE